MIQKNTLDRKNHSQTGALPHYVNPSVLSVHKRVRYLFLSFPFFPLTFFIYIYMEYRPRHGSDPPSFPRLSSRSCTSARLSKPGRPRAVPAFEPLAATRNKRNKRGRGVCVTLLYTYVHTGACKQWRAVTGGVEEERKITREGWGNAENPGFDGDDETTTCLATVKSSSSRRGTVRFGCAGLSTDVFPSTNRATFSPARRRVCAPFFPSSFSYISSSRSEVESNLFAGTSTVHQSYRRFT